jgi:hypothetical protein
MRRPGSKRGRKWRARAEECRTIAECCNNAETRETMLRMADGHERMAEHADHSDGDAAGSPGAD